jgi:hypothetical protein
LKQNDDVILIFRRVTMVYTELYLSVQKAKE